MSQNVLVVHGGGPTAVINASLYGVIEEAKRNPEVGKVYGAIGGTGAIFSETFIDLTSFDDEKLKLLLHTRQLDLPDILYMKKIMKKWWISLKNMILNMFF